jgi:hypothetical protein
MAGRFRPQGQNRGLCSDKRNLAGKGAKKRLYSRIAFDKRHYHRLFWVVGILW